MKIAIDARGVNWYKGTGIGTYTENLLKSMLQLEKENYYHIYWSGEDYEDYRFENSKIVLASRKHHRFFEQYYIPTNLITEKADIYHVPQNGIGLLEDISARKVVTIHDLIPYIMPETVGKGYVLKFLKEVPSVIQSADAIITVSQWSKKDILKFFPIDENKIHVTPLAADKKYKPLDKEQCEFFVAETYGIHRPFILYIGGFSPRKNVKGLITAFSNIYKTLPKEYDLVVVGANKDEREYLNELSKNLDLSSRIKFTGFAVEEHLPLLYNACDVFVYPSLYEGFGLPPLEAMSCGTPVITSNITSIPEVVGDAGMLIDPYSLKSLEEALGELLNNESLRTKLGEKGLKRSGEFNWMNTARLTLKAYESVMCTTPV